LESIETPPVVGGNLLDVDGAREFLGGLSRRTIHEYTRLGEIPHRVLPHGRRCLFDPDELRAWMDGAKLERIDLPGGGRIVRVCNQTGVDHCAE
jgi:helix-turn-helix protein